MLMLMLTFIEDDSIETLSGFDPYYPSRYKNLDINDCEI